MVEDHPAASPSTLILQCGNASCASDRFSILKRSRGKLHLAVLDALYIHKMNPELCAQKETVLCLILQW